MVPAPPLARTAWAWVGLLALLLPAPSARAEAEPAVEGLFVTVSHPITTEVVSRVKGATERALGRARGADAPNRSLKIVYDFNPDGRAASSDFGPCYELAVFLSELHDVHTIAFVHGETTRHTVLPVLACRDIVFSSAGRLGDVRRGEDLTRPIDPVIQEAYRKVVQGRRCPAVVSKMFDPDMELVRARRLKEGGEWFIDRRRRDAEAKEGVIVPDPNAPPVVGAGAPTTLYTQEVAEKLGLCALRKENRQEVAEAYGLPAASLAEDPLLGRTPRAWHVVVRGAITEALAESLRRQVGRALDDRANLLVLELDCGGGDTVVARDLAEFLRTLRGERGQPVLTVAYVPKKAPDTAAFLALGCTEIVLNRAATFGDFSALLTERKDGAVADAEPETIRLKRESLEGLAKAQGHPALLARAMMDRTLEVYQVRHKKTGEWAFLSGEELRADQAGAEPQWGQAQVVKEGGPRGKALVLTADEAKRWGLARHTVDNLDEVYSLYGLRPAEVREASGDWLDDLASFLRHPVTRFVLVMIGIVCLILELKLPGATAPGVIAAICFVLFFWSHSQTAGLDVLAILLFLLGLVLIALEVFVIPGFGVTGVAGTLLVVFSLALVAYEKRPHTGEEWAAVLTLMAQFGLGLVGAVLLAVLIAAYLPNIPVLNRLVLKPQAEAGEGGEDGAVESVRPETLALLGAIGVAATPLRPAGKVKFGEEYIDVVAEGGYVEPGTRVQVVEIEGNRIVVKEVL